MLRAPPGFTALGEFTSRSTRPVRGASLVSIWESVRLVEPAFLFVHLEVFSLGLAAAQEVYKDVSAKKFSLDPAVWECGSFGLHGQCSEGHVYVKKMVCGREWCPECGSLKSAMHMRRYSRWIPKAQRASELGYWVIEFPYVVRPLVRSKKVWSLIGKTVADVLQEQGFADGLRRWHWFGTVKPGRSAVWNPHLNVLTRSGHLPPARLEVVKDALRQALRQVLDWPEGAAEAIINYSVRTGVVKILHCLRYVTRATFLDADWDPDMAQELYKFRNSWSFGKWRGEEVWGLETQEDSEKLREVVELEKGLCPCCGKPIYWASRPMRMSRFGPLDDLGGGYFALSQSPAAGIVLPFPVRGGVCVGEVDR